MRLLVVTAAYPGPADPVRAVWLENLNLALSRPPETEVAVVAPRVSRTDPLEELRRGLRVRRFRYPGGRRLKDIRRPSAFVVGAYLLSAFRTSLSECRRLRPDAILCHWVLPAGPAAALAARAARAPLVLVAHGSDVNRYARSYRVGRMLARFAVRSARAAVAVSEDLRGALVRELGARPARTHVVPMGIDAALFRRERLDPEDAEARKVGARARLGLDPTRRLLLFVGDLIEEKGLRNLLAARRALEASGLAVDLVLAGEGPLRAAAEAEAPSAEGRIRTLGIVPQEELASWYRAADLLVLPSASEGCPVSVEEALACGLPVVASRVGGLPEIVDDGVTGRLVRPGDLGELERALRECLDPERLAALRRGVFASSRDDSIGARAEEFRRILAEVARWT